MLKDTWGLYQWFPEYGEDMIYAEDQKKFMDLSPNGKIFKCIDDNNGYLFLMYGEEIFRVKPDLYKPVRKPLFQIGDRVKLKNDSSQEAIIIEVNWHYKNNEHIYYISLNGKKKSRRYTSSDFVVIE
jgi:hypothetical protein